MSNRLPLPPLPPSISEEQKTNLRKRFENSSSGKKKFAAGCPVFDFDSDDDSSNKVVDYLILTAFLLLFLAGLAIGLYGTFIWLQG